METAVIYMAKEPKGFYNDSGEPLGRKEPICTTNGVIVYKGRGDIWYLEFPDDSKRYGGCTTIKLMNLVYYLNKTNGNVDKSRVLATL
jgi:hypothetical protein